MTTVAAGLVRDVYDFAVSQGADAKALLRAADIDAAAIEDQDNRLPFTAFINLLRAARELLGKPEFPLLYGSNSHFEDFSIVGLICHAADTMGEAFEQMNRYAKLVMDTGMTGASERFQLTHEGDGVWIEDLRPNPNLFPELTESTFSRFIGDFDRYIGGSRPFRAFHVTHERPDHANAYDDLFKVPVVFGSNKNALFVDASWLNISFAPQNRYTFGVLSKHANELMNDLEKSETLKGAVERTIVPMLHKGDMTMDLVAKKMGMSRPTLYRKLALEGVKFDQLLSELRKTLAIHYLEGGNASVNEVAYLVGFSDASSFSRAFKRWTGEAPTQYSKSDS